MYGALAAAAIGAGMSAYQNWSQTSGPLARSGAKLDIGTLRKQLQWQNYYQKKYDTWKADFDYKYAQQYAQNSAKWNVEGLKAAGLNPILAANNGNFQGTFGSPVSGSPASGSLRSHGSRQDMAAAAANMAATARQNALIDEQIKNVKAQTAKTEAETQVTKETNGLSGTAGALSVIAHKLGYDGGQVNTAKSLERVGSIIGRDKNGAPIINVEKVADGLNHSARNVPQGSFLARLWKRIKDAFNNSRFGNKWQSDIAAYDKREQRRRIDDMTRRLQEDYYSRH